jgi:NADPH oxidase
LALDIHYAEAGGITGHFMLLIMVLMYSTAHHKIRAQCFEAFWYTHHLAFFFMIGLFTHATGCFVRDSANPDYISPFPFYSTEHCLGYESWRFIIWPAIIYFGERVYREIRARRATRLSKLLVHPSGASSNTVFHILLRSNPYRCHGTPYRETQLQVHRRAMVVPPGSRSLSLAMASG